ncbi:MAG: DinB family protein [Flavobacteriales bacterium]|nr:DinB family protein [Flavobacteriales bacterium]
MNDLSIVKPKEGDYAPFYAGYISKAAELPILEALERSQNEVVSLFDKISEEKSNTAYAEGKWTIKEVLSHIIDAERIFTYRALRIARNDKTPLPGYEQDDFVPYSEANKRPLEELLNEYEVVRNATRVLFESFSTEMMGRKAEVSGGPMSVCALGYIISGHERHHVEVIKERYL